MASSPLRRCALVAIALLSVLLTPAVVAAAPALVAPADNAVVASRPTFTWTPAATDGAVRYQVYVGLPVTLTVPVVGLRVGDNLVAETVDASVTSLTSPIDLPEGVTLSWFVRAIDGTGVAYDTPVRKLRIAPPSPTLLTTPAALSSTTSPTFSWSGDRATSHWTVFDAGGAPVQGGEVAAASGQARAALASGAFRLEVFQRNLLGAPSAPAVATFTIDATPPAAPSISASRPSPTVGITPSFAWAGVEPGATSWWRIIGVGGVMVQGPASTPTTSASPAPLTPGSYSFEVRQVDTVGNPGPWANEPFAILPSPAAPPATAAKTRLPSSHSRRLTPKVGAVLKTVRPTLRWTAGPKGTRLYNVQIFHVGAKGVLKKIRTAFPRKRAFTLPRRAALKKGSCYVWRVWPYRGSAFTSTPLGVSNFCIRR